MALEIEQNEPQRPRPLGGGFLRWATSIMRRDELLAKMQANTTNVLTWLVTPHASRRAMGQQG